VQRFVIEIVEIKEEAMKREKHLKSSKGRETIREINQALEKYLDRMEQTELT
jgi:hypothetical protein